MRSRSASRSARPTVSWFTTSWTTPSRPAEAIRASDTNVPDEPMSCRGRSARISSSTGSIVPAIRARSRFRSLSLGGSFATSSAVSRPTPRWTLVAKLTSARSPTMSSRLPPPRSAASAGPGSIVTLSRTALKMSSASRVPSTTWIFTPVSVFTRSTTDPPSRASRIAEVPRAMISSAPFISAIALNRATTAIASSAAARPMTRSLATMSPSRSISRSRTSGTKLPSGRASTTIM